MALTQEQEDEAFDAGYQAAEEAAARGEKSLLTEILEEALGTMQDAFNTVFGLGETKEYKENFNRGVRAYQRQHEEDDDED